MSHEPQRLTDLQILSVIWVTFTLAMLVVPLLVFPDARPKSKLQTVGYALAALAWPLLVVGAMFYAAFCLARRFWNLPMIERTPE